MASDWKGYLDRTDGILPGLSRRPTDSTGQAGGQVRLQVPFQMFQQATSSADVQRLVRQAADDQMGVLFSASLDQIHQGVRTGRVDVNHVFQVQHQNRRLDVVLDFLNQLDRTNPAFVLRNHLLQKAIEQAEHGNFAEVNRLFIALSDPYQADSMPPEFMAEPPDWAKSLVLSCSS